MHGPKLVELDKTVWEIRRYCAVLDYDQKLHNGQTINMLDFELERIVDSEYKAPQKFRLMGGTLENILDKKDHPARKPLIWQNGFFGSHTRNEVKVPIYFNATNVPLYPLNPEILDEVSKYVFLPNEVVKEYRKLIDHPSGHHQD